MTGTPHLSPELAQRLRSREPLLGTLLRMPSETMIELTGLAGMDFVVIDTEHGPGDQIPLSHHLMAAAAAGLPALVRVGDVSEILRALDLGAAGIIAPHISTVEQAQALVRAAHYPPRGDRGFATYTRGGRHGLLGAAEHLARSATGTVVIAMIEDAAGVAAAEQIAAVDGIDGIFVGPADLSVALGLPGRPGSDEVRSAIAQTHLAARRAGAAVVTIAADATAARQHFRAGSDMVIYNVLAALGELFTSLAGAADTADTVDTVETVDAVDTAVPATSPAARDRPVTNARVVFLAGMLGTAQVWEDVVGRLEHPVSASSLRIDLDDTVAGMAQSVLAQAPGRFALVGHSLGGIVALEILRVAPERVSRLVLLNCSGRAPSESQLQQWSWLADEVRAGRFDRVLADQAAVNLGPAAADPHQLARWLAGARTVGPDGFLRQLAAQATRPDSRPGLAHIAIPTLVVSSAQDEVCPPALQMELASLIPGASHHTLPGVGHLSPLEPGSGLGVLLAEFLTG